MIAEVICCVCGGLLGHKDVAPIPGIKDPVSHGICEECAKKILAEAALAEMRTAAAILLEKCDEADAAGDLPEQIDGFALDRLRRTLAIHNRRELVIEIEHHKEVAQWLEHERHDHFETRAKLARCVEALHKLTVRKRDILRQDKEIIVHGGEEHDLDYPCEICAALAAVEPKA